MADEKKMSFEKMLTKFKEDCINDGIFEEMKKREYYEGPSQKRRSKALRARKRKK